MHCDTDNVIIGAIKAELAKRANALKRLAVNVGLDEVCWAVFRLI